MILKIISCIFLLSISYYCISNEVTTHEILCVPEAPPYSGSTLLNSGPLANNVVKALNLGNINVKIIHAPWSRIMHEAELAKCLVLGLWPTESRRNKFHFSSLPIVEQDIGIYTRIDKQIIEINEGTVAIERSSYIPEMLKQKNWTIYEVTSLQQGLDMLSKSRVDALYGSIGHIDYLIEKDDKFKVTISKKNPKLETKLGYLAISKNYSNAEYILKIFDQHMPEVYRYDKASN